MQLARCEQTTFSHQVKKKKRKKKAQVPDHYTSIQNCSLRRTSTSPGKRKLIIYVRTHSYIDKVL